MVYNLGRHTGFAGGKVVGESRVLGPADSELWGVIYVGVCWKMSHVRFDKLVETVLSLSG